MKNLEIEFQPRYEGDFSTPFDALCQFGEKLYVINECEWIEQALTSLEQIATQNGNTALLVACNKYWNKIGYNISLV